jgi:hypothetical protein
MLILAAPAYAVAKKKPKKPMKLGPVVTATATGPVVTTPAASSDATAICPSGLQAVGGGYSAPFTSTGAVVVTQNYRSSRNAWHVSGVLVSGTGVATAYAYCRRKTLPVTDVAQSATLAGGPGETQLAQARCAPHAVAISGGFQTTSGPQPAHLPIPELSNGGNPVPGGPQTGSWTLIAQNSNTGEQTITAHVYCATRIKAPAMSRNPAVATVPFLGQLSQIATCPPSPKPRGKKKQPKRLLSAGGFTSSIPIGTGVLPVHTESRIVGNDFIDTVVNGGSAAGAMAIESQAICF